MLILLANPFKRYHQTNPMIQISKHRFAHIMTLRLTNEMDAETFRLYEIFEDDVNIKKELCTRCKKETCDPRDGLVCDGCFLKQVEEYRKIKSFK